MCVWPWANHLFSQQSVSEKWGWDCKECNMSLVQSKLPCDRFKCIYVESRMRQWKQIPTHFLHLGYKFGSEFPSSQGEKGKLWSQQFIVSTLFKNKTMKKWQRKRKLLFQEAKIRRDTREISSGVLHKKGVAWWNDHHPWQYGGDSPSDEVLRLVS